MLIRSMRDLSGLVRDQRRRRGLSQGELAAKIGSSRKWLADFEGGKSSVDAGLVLKALGALRITLDASVAASPAPGDVGESGARVDLDAHLEKLQED